MRLCWAVGMAVLAVALAGCDPAPRATQPSAVDGQVATPLPTAVFDGLDTGGLRTRAAQALRAQRIHAPAGDSAVDYYLALRERSPDASGVAAALTELQPYVLIAAEQALAREDLEEARRLLGLLSRMDAGAPALPRLREGVRIAQERADRDEGAKPAPPARPTERPLAIAPQAPTPVRPPAPAPTAPAPTTTPAIASTQLQPAPTAAPTTSARIDEVPPTSPVAREAAPAALPRLLADAAPRYPLAARNRRIEGSVLVAFTIQPDGRVGDVQSLSAQPEGVFEEAALSAAARWRFEATGRSVRTTRVLTFRLPDEAGKG